MTNEIYSLQMQTNACRRAVLTLSTWRSTLNEKLELRRGV